MENITEALKMAAAILLFVGALSLTIATFTKVRQTSAAVMENSDKNTSFYDNIDYSSEKIVGLETIVTNCYLYYKNYNTILFYTGHLDSDNNLVIDRKMPLYNTESLPVDDEKTGKKKINSNLLINNIDGTDLSRREIYGLDINDERSRKEPWIGTDLKNRNFVTSFLKAEKTEGYSWSRTALNASNIVSDHKLSIGFLYTNYTNGRNFYTGNSGSSSMKFVERIGTYKYNYKNDEENSDTKRPSNLSTTMQQYVDKDNQVVATLENNDENTQVKKVIQYIYIVN